MERMVLTAYLVVSHSTGASHWLARDETELALARDYNLLQVEYG